MSYAENDRRIDYIEFPVRDIAAVKKFYGDVFGWSFQDWGDDYASFSDGRLAGGFRREPEPATGGPLVVLYGVDLEDTQRRVESAGGTIDKPIFSFPGGRRFEFRDPAGHALAVWSDQGLEA
jgi:predicted enzyme related to lactoylglutathione lyase